MLWGAFNNASSAMQAMSWDMGSISQNIANVNTTGYKRKETLFKTVMSESHAAPSSSSGGRLNIFGVQTADRYHIAVQGVIAPSTYGNDLAINGSGFFMVAPAGDDGGLPSSLSTDDPRDVLYTRDGGFSNVTGSNDESYFVTGSGHYLLGWMADENGTVQPGGTLAPVYSTPETLMVGRATTTGEVRANLPAQAARTPNSFTTDSIITDPNGVDQTLTVTWQRVDGTTWTVTPSVDTAVGAVSSAPIAVTMDGWGNISAPDPVTQAVTVNWDDAAYGAATADSSTNLNVSSSKPTIHLEKINMAVYDADGVEHMATLAFERGTFLTPPPAQTPAITNLWYVHPTSGQNATAGVTSPAIELMFDSNGELVNASTPITMKFSWTSATGVVTDSTVDVDLSAMQQYDGELYIGNVDQNGYGQGSLLKSGFNELGEYSGFFSNGETRVLFKVPIAQFVSENHLDPISGNLFARTAKAGDMTVSAVEDAIGEPRFVAGALETSTVDIEDEFTKMIVTQKAYSTNAQVFRTADEMTTVARDLKA